MAILAFPGAGALELRFFLRGGWRVSILARFALLFDCVDIGLLAPTGVWSCVSRFRARPDTNDVAEQALYVRGRLRGEFEAAQHDVSTSSGCGG